jgi:hypothetical protein
MTLVACKGVDLFEIRSQPVLLQLNCVRARAGGRGADVLVLEDNFRELLTSLCQVLEPKARCSAALGLLGLVAATRGQNPTVRRRYAAELVAARRGHGTSGVEPSEDFRQQHERTIVRDVAAQLWLHELDHLARREISVVPKVHGPAHEPSSKQGANQPAWMHPAPEAPEGPRAYAKIGAAYTYHVRENYQSHGYTREFEIEAVRNAPNPFKHWYKWSGSGIAYPPIVVSPNHRSLGEPQVAQDGLTFFHVHLDEHLRVGQRTRIKIEQEFYDSNRTFRPILSARNSDAGLEWLTLRVLLPLSRPPSKVTYGVWNPRRDGEEQVRLEDGGFRADDELEAIVIEWSPPVLRYDHRYAIQWSYLDGDSIYPLTD